MIVYESLKDNRDLLIRLARTGIAVEDVKHLELYEDFVRLRADGRKLLTSWPISAISTR